MLNIHTFHIPVMGIGFTIESPLKLAHKGIDSAISVTDDELLEKLRKKYCEKYKYHYDEISNKVEDFRAKRITSYLNLISDITDKTFADFKLSLSKKKEELISFLETLNNESILKKELLKTLNTSTHSSHLSNVLDNYFSKGSLDINIMTKLDKANFVDNKQLPIEFNDAHAALRGFSNSKLSSSVIFSAGMNPRLYSYLESFDDFYPSTSNQLKKKVILKVSDYRSALVQGKILAKKGIWVSEYRIESGLNCGGHAFATDGLLMGTILSMFKENKQELINETHALLQTALKTKNKHVPTFPLPIKITAQGGVGTSEEHFFLIENFEVDSVGWGSPFLLVPEATTVDQPTLSLLANAKEKDLYLSNISPLGVPFNNLRGNTKDIEKEEKISKGKPGSNCPKKILALNIEHSDKGLCTASREYQYKKIKELKAQNLEEEAFKTAYNKVVEKSCICVGLGTSALLNNNIDTKVEGPSTSICPGPNMAYFSKIVSLKDMVQHIYGNKNVIEHKERPHMFVKELSMYVEHFITKIEDYKLSPSLPKKKSIQKFTKNLNSGIEFYLSMFKNSSIKGKQKIATQLMDYKQQIEISLNKMN